MKVNQSNSLKKSFMCIFIFLCGIIFAYVGLVLIVSLSIGLKYIDQSPSWLPILTGITGMIAVIYSFFRIIKHTINHKRTDKLKSSLFHINFI